MISWTSCFISSLITSSSEGSGSYWTPHSAFGTSTGGGGVGATGGSVSNWALKSAFLVSSIGGGVGGLGSSVSICTPKSA